MKIALVGKEDDIGAVRGLLTQHGHEVVCGGRFKDVNTSGADIVHCFGRLNLPPNLKVPVVWTCKEIPKIGLIRGRLDWLGEKLAVENVVRICCVEDAGIVGDFYDTYWKVPKVIKEPEEYIAIYRGFV